MDNLFKGFEDFVEFLSTIEERVERGELFTEGQFSVRNFSNSSSQNTIPRSDTAQADRPPATATEADRVIVTPPPQAADRMTLRGVGGLAGVLKELRELVELPLKRPELLSKLGLEPPHGVLLVGSPGTGKTLTARSLAEALGVNYIAIVGPEVIGKYYGEAEARLRTIFEKASKAAPCIVFIDEIDSLAPDRTKVEGEVEKRLVAQLLSLMDGFAETKGVIVLAATNRPEHLDPALRRPGRFDREVQFRVPDREGRLEILKIQTRVMPLEATVNLEAIADFSVGMVGADLKAVCQKAAYVALQRQVPDLQDTIPDRLTISQADFLQALQAVKPSVLRSLEIESPNVDWADIGGLDSVKQTLQESVEGALLYPELYRQTGAQAPRGILMWGAPGTGKTLLAKAIASQARANFISVSGSELLSKWIGAAEQAVRELFQKARQAAPCVIFIDEIDTLAPARGSFAGDSGVSDRVVGQLLTELDGLRGCPDVLLVAATNRPDALDPALLRSGRLDIQLKIDLPDEPSRLAILRVHNGNRPLEQIDLAYWASQTPNWNGADLALLSNQAALQAVRRFRSQGLLDPTAIRITTADFEAAYEAIVSQKAAQN